MARRTTRYRASQIQTEAEKFINAILAAFHEPVDTTPEGTYVAKNLLNEVIWKHTERGAKYLNCKWWTEEAIKRRRLNEKSKPYSGIQLEHVKDRSTLIRELLKPDALVGEIMATAETCVVTKDEHVEITEGRKKNSDLPWRDLYASIGIRIVMNPFRSEHE